MSFLTYASEMRSLTGMYAAWPLPSTLRVGDFGRMKHGVFNVKGRLGDCGLVLDVADSSPLNELVLLSDCVRETGAQLDASMKADQICDAIAAGTLHFGGSQAIKLIAKRVVTQTLQNLRAITRDVQILRKLVGFGTLNYVVTKVQSIESGEIIILRRKTMSAAAAANVARNHLGAGAEAHASGAGVSTVGLRNVSGPVLFDLQRVILIGKALYAGAQSASAIIDDPQQGGLVPIEDET